MGIKFRSRMEARWAVFWHRLNINWTYEPCTLNLPVFGPYIPDFKLCALGGTGEPSTLVEVKPEYPTELEIQKARAAIPLSGAQGIILVIGNPDYRGYWMLTRTDIDDEVAIVFDWGGIKNAQDFQIAKKGESAYCTPSDEGFSVQYRMALEYAMSARFDGYDPDRQKIKERYQ